eukprot:437082_1
MGCHIIKPNNSLLSLLYWLPRFGDIYPFNMNIFHFLDGQDPSIIEISSNIKVSCLSVMATSNRIICIFMLKQAFSMYYRMKKGQQNKAIFIKMEPNIVWNNKQINISESEMISQNTDVKHEKEQEDLDELNIDTFEIKPHRKHSNYSISFTLERQDS